MQYKGYNVWLYTIKRVSERNEPEGSFYDLTLDGAGVLFTKSWFRTAPKVGDELLAYRFERDFIGFDLNGRCQFRKPGFHARKTRSRMNYKGCPVTTSASKIQRVEKFRYGAYLIFCNNHVYEIKRRSFKVIPHEGDTIKLYLVGPFNAVGCDLNGRRQWRKRGFHKGNPPKRTK